MIDRVRDEAEDEVEVWREDTVAHRVTNSLPTISTSCLRPCANEFCGGRKRLEREDGLPCRSARECCGAGNREGKS